MGLSLTSKQQRLLLSLQFLKPKKKAGISIKSVNVGLPANLLQVEPTQGMIPVTSDTKEITDQDVENVVKSALTKSMTPDREVITFIPEEFVVDGFQGIRDPRGMMGVRLECVVSCTLAHVPFSTIFVKPLSV